MNTPDEHWRNLTPEQVRETNAALKHWKAEESLQWKELKGITKSTAARYLLATSPSPHWWNAMSAYEAELGQSQLDQCTDSIAQFAQSGRSTSEYILVYNRRGGGSTYHPRRMGDGGAGSFSCGSVPTFITPFRPICSLTPPQQRLEFA